MDRTGRSPHGERGLKYCNSLQLPEKRGRRSPHGERGLKSVALRPAARGVGRSPHGERGLKFAVREDEVSFRVALLMESVD